ncbi:DUF1345 domain-containing protein [Actinomycetospora sp. TBRC 11914]|uniref:DUF1345 domain-containing protein n=1 Tax=Actinomycetospora sp. TBRC 11914 TaxID=2729387 RepID=UPI00145EA90B|nr:DUF1345 domain-containing protein [Actinomycetospora sp. TBRC 11914]NMO94017.1 DUF1345 domain-containing protein [Actinomycetospora sp. TBRC 11914]
MTRTSDGSAVVSPLCSDGRRAVIATAIGVLVPVVVGLVLGAIDPGRRGPAVTLVLALGGWNLFVVVYVALTLRTFAGTDQAEFEAKMARRRASRSWVVRRLTPGGDGPTFALEAALVAFGVVLVLPHITAIDLDDLVLIPVTISILLCSWALAVVSYALHYADKDGQEAGLEFPGTRTHTFADYRYFSMAVATTFGATDVSITTPRMRRVVNLHTLLTFAYNTVIVAALASFLIH